MSFTLAHLSDVHLGPLPLGGVFAHFKGKRIIGALSWALRRRRLHLMSISSALMENVLAAAPDHIAVTGDMVNISAWTEFPAARAWLQKLGASDRVSFVPGNHDAYVSVPYENGLKAFAPWMKPDVAAPGAPPFPFMRLRRNVALIGVNSGCPQRYNMAGGTLGPEQLRDLSHMLANLQSQGFFRVLMIHHPPLPGMAVDRKALTDASALQDVLKNQGCELVLHGHNHMAMENWLETKSGQTPIIGVPSASGAPRDHFEAAGWNLYGIRRHQGRWQTEITRSRWNAAEGRFETQPKALLLPP